MKKTKRLFRVGIIGLGRIGFTLQFDKKREQPASHSAAFSGEKRCVLSGGFDRDLAKMAEWSKRYPRAKIYDNLNEMLSDGVWDILVIAVGEKEHLPVVKIAAASGPGLIVLEKPAAPSVKDALLIKKTCSLFRVPVCINHERRFSKDYRLAAGLTASGEFGKIVSVNAFINSSNYAWYRGDYKEGRGTLVHDGTHLVDAIRFLTGENIRIGSASLNGKEKNGNIAGVSASGTIGKDIAVNMRFGYRTSQFEFEIDLVFEKGRIRVGNGILEVYRSQKSPYYEGFHSLVRDKAYSPGRTGKTGYFSGMASNCADFLEGKSVLVSNLDDGVEAMKTVEAIARAAGCR